MKYEILHDILPKIIKTRDKQQLHYIYIYIYRERERERERPSNVQAIIARLL
jgi:hypothetical protein